MTDWLLEVGFLMANWKWIGLAGVAFVGVLVDRVVIAALEKMLGQFLARGGMSMPEELTGPGLRPFGLLAMALLWTGALPLLALPTPANDVLQAATTFFGAAAGVWGAYRLVDVLSAVLEQKAGRTNSRFDDLLVPLIRKGLKIVVAAFGLVFVASNLNIDISSLLAGLGIGGLALALAAQDMVKNLFGTVTVVLDRPFDVGDWIKVGDVEGTVESVGFRSTRVRTFYNSLVTVPNGNLLSAVVDNLGAREHRRWSTTLSLTYDTPPDRVEAFCEGVRELIRSHPYTRKDYFQVYFNGFGASSLDVLLYVFHTTPDWSTELRERHRLGLDILRLARTLEVEFAFPTQTLHLFRGEPSKESGARSGVAMGANAPDALLAGRAAAAGIAKPVNGHRPPPVDFGLGEGEDRGSK